LDINRRELRRGSELIAPVPQAFDLPASWPISESNKEPSRCARGWMAARTSPRSCIEQFPVKSKHRAALHRLVQTGNALAAQK